MCVLYVLPISSLFMLSLSQLKKLSRSANFEGPEDLIFSPL